MGDAQDDRGATGGCAAPDAIGEATVREPAQITGISALAALVVLGAVLASAGVLALMALSEQENADFLGEPRSLIFELLFISQSALWAGVGVFLLGSLRRLRSAYGIDRDTSRRIALWTLLIVVLASAGVVPSWTLTPEYALSDEWAYRFGVQALGFFVMALAIISMWLVGAASVRVLQTPPDGQLGEYMRLRADLHDFLNAAAAIIGMSILVVAARRGATLAGGTAAEGFPPEYLIYYGAYYSALLAFAYAPAHRAFAEVGAVLRDRLCPLPTGPADSWANWWADRKALEASLGLDVVGSKAIQTGLALATPLLGSAAGLVFGIGA